MPRSSTHRDAMLRTFDGTELCTAVTAASSSVVRDEHRHRRLDRAQRRSVNEILNDLRGRCTTSDGALRCREKEARWPDQHATA
jgi:hypothetical protein